MAIQKLPDVALRIDGRPVPSTSDQVLAVINPANGRQLFDLPIGSEADVNAAVQSARRIFESGAWWGMEPEGRKKLLHKWADLVERNAETLDQLDAVEMGKPLRLKAFNAMKASSLVRFYAETIDKAKGDVLSSDRHSTVIRKGVPRGVVAAITPWNFPTYNAAMKIAPALAAGNSIVLKPSELSSQAALMLADLACEAGIPPGAVNVVPGAGQTTGKGLALHGDVDMVVFMGSSDVGKLMLQYSGQSNMKPVIAECGGKSPQIVFDDGVDLDAAAAAVATGITVNQGQWCSAGSRLLVQRSIEAAFVEAVVQKLRDLVVGDPLDNATDLGPLVSERQLNRVLSYIDSGNREGAELIYGGKRLQEATGGYYLEPTVFRKVSSDSRIAREEIFGPVLSVMSFTDVDHAIRLANSTDYGLSAYVWTASLATGFSLGKGIRAGAVVVNANPPFGPGPGAAYTSEAYGLSGIGIRGGMPGLMAYQRQHLVWFNHQ
ncbi:aldehyde dehydrogenase family protein [Rhodoligotrophos defluvii]|uniref:aldehyde dehydrogenase family protein n=1 Tax=Rhodoligotrophos defluvii TaxID=2561934 RepID=UPI0010C9FF5B|nr:aldehyde dehydrogenase family protein [Rhodoligotrophos defluvii]